MVKMKYSYMETDLFKMLKIRKSITLEVPADVIKILYILNFDDDFIKMYLNINGMIKIKGK